jgi:hypothetical protein
MVPAPLKRKKIFSNFNQPIFPKMKIKFYAILLMMGVCLSSCMLNPPKPVTTKEETISALMGTWKPKDPSQTQIKSISFGDQDAKGEYRVKIKIARDSTAIETFDGTWVCTDVGRATLNYSMNLSSDVVLKNTRIMLVEETQVFTK